MADTVQDKLPSGEQRLNTLTKEPHFFTQAAAEKAYFQVRAVAAERGQLIQRLSNRLGNTRQRNRELSRENQYLKLENAKQEVRLLGKKAHD